MKRIPCDQCLAQPACVVRDLPPDGLTEFRGSSVTATYKRRQVIFHENAPADTLYMLCHGAVKLYQSDRFGRDHILAIAGPGEVLSELGLDPATAHSVSAETVSESQVCSIARDRVIALISRYPMAGVRLIGALGQALGSARRKVRELALKRAEGRLAELLMRLGGIGSAPPENGASRVVLAYSRRELAEMIGVSTETAIRLLGTGAPSREGAPGTRVSPPGRRS